MTRQLPKPVAVPLGWAMDVTEVRWCAGCKRDTPNTLLDGRPAYDYCRACGYTRPAERNIEGTPRWIRGVADAEPGASTGGRSGLIRDGSATTTGWHATAKRLASRQMAAIIGTEEAMDKLDDEWQLIQEQAHEEKYLGDPDFE